MKERKRQKLNRIIASIMTMILVFTQFPIDGTHRSYATDDDPVEPPTVVSVNITTDWTGNRIYPGSKYQKEVKLRAVVEMSDGSPYSGDINWISDNTKIASVNNGTVTAGIEPGTANITAEAGGIKSDPYSITVEELEVVSISLPENEDMTLGETGRSLNLSYKLNDNDVRFQINGLGVVKTTWSSDKTDIVEIDETGNLTAKDYGNATITATVETKNKGELTASCTVNVGTKVSSLEFTSPSSDVIKYSKDGKVDFSVAIVGEGLNEEEKEKIKWESSNESVIRLNGEGADNKGVDAKGVLVSVGDATIKAKLGTSGVIVSKEFHVRQTVAPLSISINHALERIYDGTVDIEDKYFIINWPEGLTTETVCSDVTFTAESPNANNGGCNVTAHFTCNESYTVDDYMIYGFKIKQKTISMNGITIAGQREYKKGDTDVPSDALITYSFTGVIAGDVLNGEGVSYKFKNDEVGENKEIKKPDDVSGFRLNGDKKDNYICAYNTSVVPTSTFSITKKSIYISSKKISKESDGTSNVILTGTNPRYIAVGMDGEAVTGIKVTLKDSADKSNWVYEDAKPGKDKTITGASLSDFTVKDTVDENIDLTKNYTFTDVKLVGDIKFKTPAKSKMDLTTGNTFYLSQDVQVSFPEAINLKNEKPLWYSEDTYATTFTFAEGEEASFVDVTDEEKILYSETDVVVPLIEGKDKETKVYIKKGHIYYGPVTLKYSYDKTNPSIGNINVFSWNEGPFWNPVSWKELTIDGKDSHSGIFSIKLLNKSASEIEPTDPSEFDGLSNKARFKASDNIKVYALIEDKAGNWCILLVDKDIVEDITPPEIKINKIYINKESNYTNDNNIKSFKIGCTAEDYDSSGIKRLDWYLFDGKEEPIEYAHDGKTNNESYPNNKNIKTLNKDIELSGANHPGYELRLVIEAEDNAGNTTCKVYSYSETNEFQAYILKDDDGKEVPFVNKDDFLERVNDKVPTFALDGNPVMSIRDAKTKDGYDAEAQGKKYKDNIYYFDVAERTINITFKEMGYPKIIVTQTGSSSDHVTEFTGTYNKNLHCYMYRQDWSCVFPEQTEADAYHSISVEVVGANGDSGRDAFPFGTLDFPDANKKFVLDGTKPEIKITFTPDTPVASKINKNFYKDTVIATVRITDNNLPDINDFNENYYKITGLNNQSLPKPEWTKAGNSIIGTMTFVLDGDYHPFDVEVTDLTLRTDMAKENSKNDFVIDKTIPTFDISYSAPTNPNPEGFKYYYGLKEGLYEPTDVVATITLVERNLFYDEAEKGLKVYKIDDSGNEEEVSFWNLAWAPDVSIGEKRDRTEFEAKAYVTIPGKGHDGEYRVELDYADIVGHDMIGANDNIKPYVKNGLYEGKEHINVIDTIRPEAVFNITELNSKYSFNDETDQADYYNKEFTASFNVAEKNFKDGARFLHAEYDKDGVLNKIEPSEGAYSHTVKAVSDNEAGYHFSISGNDLAMNKLKVVEGIGWTVNDKLTAEDDEYFTSGKKVLDITAPVLRLDIEPNSGATNKQRQTFEGTTRYYFNDAFNAKFTIWEKNFYNDYVTALYGYNGTAVNYAADKVDIRTDLGEFENSGDRSPNEYRLSELFTAQGLYQFSIEGEDKAGNLLAIYDSESKDHEFETIKVTENGKLFTSYVVAIDQTHPALVDIEIGDFYKATLDWLDGEPHYQVSLNHPYQRIDSTTVKFIRSDKSPANITYDIISTVGNQNRTNEKYTYGYEQDGHNNGYVCTIPMNGQQVFYLANISMTDYAGNTFTWGGPSNKIYLDVTPPNHDELAPTVQAAAIADGSGRGPEGNPLFASDVDVRITVEDPNEVVSSSGLYQLFYRVLVNGEDMTGTTTPSTTTGAAGGGIVSFYSSGPNYSENADTTDEELTYRSELSFHFDKNTYNCNDIKIYVWGGDDAGNEIPENNAAYYAFGIDSTNPTITVSYDNNDVRNEKYFKADRTATVTVMERNFDPTRTVITTEAGARIGGWEYRRGNSANGDDDKWISHVRYDHDGNYTFNVTAIDLVGNEAPPANYGESAAPKAFVVDKTVPVINVTFDNNDVHNGKYYNKKRIADVEITEHNFNAADVRISNPVSLDGSRIGSPRISAWEGAGDRKSASLTHSADGDYTLRIDYTDLAGNVAESYVADEFTIDTTAPELIITGVEDKHAYNDKVAPVIEYSDLNLDGDSAKVEISGMLHKENNSLEGVKTQDENGGSLVCSDIEHIKANDDVYTAVGVIKDLAGNETKKEITFSVNRFGSNYIISDETQQLIDTVYTNKEQSIHVTEINVSDLDKNEVDKAVNGNIDILEDGTDYNLKVSKPGWVQYEYDISAENFAEEGSYVVTLYSEDKAANKNSNRSVRDENGVNELPIEFVVDKTAPSIIVSGVEQNGRYYDRERTIILHYEDNNIATRLEVTDALGNVTVYYLDAYYDGSEDSRDIRKVAPASQYIAIQPNAEGDIELKIQALNRKQSVSIKAVDAAGNETEFSSPRFLLTTNLFVQFINNTAAIIISLVVLALAGAIVLVIVQRRRKKNNA